MLHNALAAFAALALFPMTAFAQAAPLGCDAIPMAPAEAGRITFPAPQLKLSRSDAAFPKATLDAMNGAIQRAKALGQVTGLSVYRQVQPAEMARLQNEAFAQTEGWRPALAGGLREVAPGRFLGIYSDGKADVILRVEASPGWPHDGIPLTSEADRAKLRELASRGETVLFKVEGRGLARAACEGRIPEVVGAGAPTPGQTRS